MSQSFAIGDRVEITLTHWAGRRDGIVTEILHELIYVEVWYPDEPFTYKFLMAENLRHLEPEPCTLPGAEEYEDIMAIERALEEINDF